MKTSKILSDYQLAVESREISLQGRKEVFAGKAKFGIFGDGKEIAQIAMANFFQKGDYLAGYYRDQTIIHALKVLNISQFFSQIYAHPDLRAEPCSGGRMMNSHFATRMLDESGNFIDLTKNYNVTANLSANAAHIPRLLGLAYASKLYRQNKQLNYLNQFSVNGNEVAFGTIGDAATSEGLFLEAMNAAGVLQVPLCIAVWDDDYGISVPKLYHTTKKSISLLLKGLQTDRDGKGFEIFEVKGWDYEALNETFKKASQISRTQHIPTLVHVTELTQPQGHSTSGSHHRYKSQERLAWEEEHECIKKMKEWILNNQFADVDTLEEIKREAQKTVRNSRQSAWKAFRKKIQDTISEATSLLTKTIQVHPTYQNDLQKYLNQLQIRDNTTHLDPVKTIRQSLVVLRNVTSPIKQEILSWLEKKLKHYQQKFNTYLYSESKYAYGKIESIPIKLDKNSQSVPGYEILNRCFDEILQRDKRVFFIGEDVGKLGDVNQTLAGLQKKYGETRITDTGIREATIVGQGIGTSMRGFKPIVEIQYLDYLLYALQTISDDLASLHYRTCGGQKAPLIIRTRGHRLEGIWHSGSYIAGIMHHIRGLHLLVPRNMTQAAGFYNTLLKIDEPAILIECLNGYRQKELLPSNISKYNLPLGVPEILGIGNDVTVVTYGAMCNIVLAAVKKLAALDIMCEVIDVQTLLPFDVHHKIVASIKKTNKIALIDEDVPGGTTAYMLQKILEEQKAYDYLDSAPITITAKPHRPAYGNDGDYFSKPNEEDVFEKIYAMMHDNNPKKYPTLF